MWVLGRRKDEVGVEGLVAAVLVADVDQRPRSMPCGQLRHVSGVEHGVVDGKQQAVRTWTRVERRFAHPHRWMPPQWVLGVKLLVLVPPRRRCRRA